MGTPYRPPSAGTAETMALIGVIFQVIFVVIFLFGVGLVGLLGALAVASTGIGAGFALVWASIFIVIGLIAVLFLWVGYARVYQRIKRGEYEAARSTGLILWILLFVTLQILPAIFYLVAWIKLGDAVNEMRNPPQWGSQPPMAQQPAWGQPAPAQQPAPAMAPAAAPAAAPMAAAPAQAPVCPRCGKPATWIAQYGRYYCYTDQTYL